jgi:carboxypeptidase C (cathepsin A)
MLFSAVALSSIFSISFAASQQHPFVPVTANDVVSFPIITSLQDGLTHEVIKSTDFPMHTLRMKPTPSDLCDTTVKSYSGYLDIANDKSLFFWMFESRSNPAKDPLALWLVPLAF